MSALLAPATVLTWLGAALGADPAARAAAERELQAAEEAAAPGFVESLLDVVDAVADVAEVGEIGVGGGGAGHWAATAACGRGRLAGRVRHSDRRSVSVQLGAGRSHAAPASPPLPEPDADPAASLVPSQPARLLAAVLLKNLAGESPTKTLSSREWLRVPGGERAAARARLVPALLADPSRRVAAALALAVANIARFDFPAAWPGLLAELAAASAWASGRPPTAQAAALLGLKRVLAALRGRRLVLDPRFLGVPGAGLDLRALARAAADERSAVATAVGATVAPLTAEWSAHLRAALDPTTPDADAAGRGALAARCLHALRGAARCLPDWPASNAAPALEAMCDALLSSGAALADAGAVGAEPPGARGPALARCAERGVQVATACLERAPLDLAPAVPRFLPLYGRALLAGAGVPPERARAKARVALTRFLARALLTPQYRSDWLEAATTAARTPAAREKAAAAAAAATPAVAALDDLAGGPGVRGTLAALVSAYVALSPGEAAEWEADPEGYVLAADADASPDADAPRPCALALVACLVDRGGGAAADALLDLAKAAAAAPASDAASLLLREAVYRALGECGAQPDLADRVDAGAWWRGELRGLLAARPPSPAPSPALSFAARALTARAAWIAGVSASRLPAEDWGDVLDALTSLLSAPDLVVALSAAAALGAALGDAIDDLDADAAGAPGDGGAGERARAVAPRARRAVAGLVALLPRVVDDESAVRLLGAVSAVFELAGPAAATCLPDLAAALPPVWARAADAATGGGAGPGAAARLHAALLAVLTHVLRRLGRAALASPALPAVLWPLLEATTDPSHPEADSLRDDGLRLLRAALGAGDGVPESAAALLPRAVALAAAPGSGDRRPALGLLEAAVYLGGCACLGGCAQGAADAVATAAADAVAAAAADDAPPRDGPPTPPPPPSAARPPPGRQSAAVRAAARARKAADDAGAARDAAAALGLAGAMLQTDAGAAAALEPALKAAAALLAPPPRAARAPALLADAAAAALARALAPAPAALAALAPPGDDGGRLLDGWLRAAASAPLEEVLGLPPALAAGRARRAGAAAALASIAVAGPPPPLAGDVRRSARVLALIAAAADEAPALAEDNAELDAAVAEAADAAAGWGVGPPPPDTGTAEPDSVFRARVAAAARDPLRRRDTGADFAAAARALGGGGRRDALLAAVADVGGGALADRVRAAIGG
jgi:hypothetical protein